MSNRKKTSRNNKTIRRTSKPRKFYRKPYLQELGDLRSLTLGGSPGAGDSGSAGTEFPQGIQGGPLLPPEY